MRETSTDGFYPPIIVPVDFFEANPAIDVPSNKNKGSQLADACCEGKEKSKL